DARHGASLATAHDQPARCQGNLADLRLRASSSPSDSWFIGVRLMPGAMAVPLILCSATSSASVLVRLRNPPLAASYAVPPGVGISSCTEVTLMTLPPPPACVRRSMNSRQQR